MRSSSRPEPTRGAAATLGLCLFLFPAVEAWCASPALDYSVRHVDTRLDGETWLLDAGVDLELNPESRKALESGVPITVLLEVEVTRERLLRDKRVRHIRIRYRIEKHALSERYMVTYAASGKTRTYDAFEDASASVGMIRGLALIQRGELVPDHRHRIRLRALLDIEALPSPLRPLAWFRSLWRVRGDWFSWMLTQ